MEPHKSKTVHRLHNYIGIVTQLRGQTMIDRHKYKHIMIVNIEGISHEYFIIKCTTKNITNYIKEIEKSYLSNKILATSA